MGELLVTKRVPLLDWCTNNVMTKQMMSQLRPERLIDISWAKGKTVVGIRYRSAWMPRAHGTV